MEKQKQFWRDFRAFISRGNVLDMAIGIIIGSAFTAIVTSIVGDIFTPLLAKLLGGISFSELKLVLTPAAGDVAETAIRYGVFLEKVIYFLLVALVVFIVIRQLGKLKRKKEEAPPKPDPQLVLLEEIRDLLKEQNQQEE